MIGKYDRNDLLERLGDQVSIKDKLRFGRTWCHRFYKRDKFVSRIASTKMRDEIPADYEAKKERFLLHFSKAISELIVYVTKVLIPYRTKTIQELGLHADQKMVYIYDLHYSHKDASVLALLDANNIIPIFIPASCTDLHQVCDVCINKPYKNGVAAEFIDYLSTKYTDWYNSTERDEESIFKVNLSLGVTKPLISSYVSRGISQFGN